MSKYLVETYYTCTFKLVHTLDELNEKKLSELENRDDGKYEIIDIKLNNRKTKTIDNSNKNLSKEKATINSIPGFSSLVSKKIVAQLLLNILACIFQRINTHIINSSSNILNKKFITYTDQILL